MNDKIKGILAKVVTSLVSLVETADGGNWIRPWVNLGLGKQYRSNGELYRGTNQIFLGLIAVGLGLEGPHIWAGYDSWHEAGWTVRKGEKSPYTPIYAYLVVNCKEHGKPEDLKETCCDQQVRFRRIKLVRPVWHRSQVDNIRESGVCHKAKCELEPSEHIEATLPATPVAPTSSIAIPVIMGTWRSAGMDIREVDPDRAYYDHGKDYINLPPLGAFSTGAGYYSTLFHEAAHWTGHESRLNRSNKAEFGAFGSPEYAAEELVADISAAMTGAVLGFEPELSPNHGEYLKSWLGALEDDPGKLYEAAVEAERASEMLLALGKVKAVAA